jgi:hypothetical protein
MAQQNLKLIALVVAAVCGLAVAQNNFGTVYGDTSGDVPYLQSLSPLEGPKQGGTQITIQGAGFKDDSRAQCRFSRLNPSTETTVTKVTPSTYVSSTEVSCAAPAWEEDECTSCAGTNKLSGTFYGHTGSPYLRSSSIDLIKEIGVGDYIKLQAGRTHHPSGKVLVQYYQVKAIETCSAATGCYCGGSWTTKTPTEDHEAYSVKLSYNGTGVPHSSPTTGFEVVTSDASNCALYRYDMMNGGAGDANSPLPKAMWPSAGGVDCEPKCSSAWAAGTKVTLSEPVYKIDGTPNQVFTGKSGWRATKFSCTSCKCAGGCKVTVSHTNDGKAYSGGGIGGEVWSGSGLAFSLKDIVPTVSSISHNLPGYRDSTRVFGPASGGTTITVTGQNFQDSPLLRCYFAGVRTLVKAEYIDSEHVRCKSPPFMSRQLDGGTTVLSNQDGAAMNPHSKVHVTNDGMIGDMAADGTATGHISLNPHKDDDGSYSYLRTMATHSCTLTGCTTANGCQQAAAGQCSNYNSGQTGFEGNPFRSTCQQGRYPNEANGPCYGAHHNLHNGAPGGTFWTTPKLTVPNQAGAPVESTVYSAGNDVLFKYATCYDANPAGEVASLNTYGTAAVGGKFLNSTAFLGQKIKQLGTGVGTAANNRAGPLVQMAFHFEKATDPEAVVRVKICAGSFCAYGGTSIAEETVIVSKIVPAAINYKYNVFFNTPAYLLEDKDYYVQVNLVSGAQDVEWKTAASSTHGLTGGGYYANTNYATGNQFRLQGSTCDGCRTKYAFNPASPKSDQTFGAVPAGANMENGGSTYLADGKYRSMLAQELRPTETGTITHASLQLNNADPGVNNGISQAYVSAWITTHGKYGEYVCSVYGGLQMENTCDTNFDGTFSEACYLGSVCDPNAALNGGCGDRGACTLATTATNGHRLRPEGGGVLGPCGHSSTCAVTMTLAPDHMKIVKNKETGNHEVLFEFKTPVPVEKHTTYFLNVAVVGNTDISKPVIWKSGVARGDGGIDTAAFTDGAGDGKDANPAANELRAAYIRRNTDWRWEKIANRVFAVKFTRCVSSTAQVHGFTTTGDKTGCCSARASPQGGDKGAEVIITGRNFFPSDRLSCLFRNEDGTTGAKVPGKVLDASYTKMSCKAPTLNPHSTRDCTNPALCQGTVLQVTNDGFTVGPQYLGPKWDTGTAGAKDAPAYLGLNPLKFLFTEIFVAVTGSDTVGDGTLARPYQTIQKGVDAANEYDQIVLLAGTYVGLGNRGLRHHGKRIQLMAKGGDRQNTIIDCQHAPDGFILNNNKDSDSPFAGYIDTQDIITRNCENLRIYDI